MAFRIVIPSRKPTNLIACVWAIVQFESGFDLSRIIVIDDGARTQAVEAQYPELQWVAGVKPFIFSRNVNLGIAAAAPDDVLLLNDDALLRTVGGFSKMAKAAEYRWGLVSASTNCGNICQSSLNCPGVREDTVHVPSFICVYLPRRTLDYVGPFDERFIEYGWEDNDYCRRTRNAGMRIGIFDHCFVDHATIDSTFRGRAGSGGNIQPGWKIYQEKWGKGAT